MHKRTRYRFVFISVILIWLLCGCTPQPYMPVYHKNGETYGTTSGAFFRHRWWNHYERGLSYAEGRYFDDAVTDLNAALALRDMDQRMARTYGMHFMDYFPHRELGIIYYETGDIENAERYLSLSIEEYPSAKAYYFLNQVRRERIRRSGRLVALPTIRLDFEDAVIRTRDDPVTITGAASDDNFIEALSINNQPVFMEASQKEVSFRSDLSLPQGMHLISIQATNLTGKTAERHLEIHIDRQGPFITVETVSAIKQVNETAWEVKGVITDPSGVVSVHINSEPLSAASGERISFRFRVPPGQQTLHIDALDHLGNVSQADIPIQETATRPSSYLVAATDMGMIAGLFAPADRQAPVIRLKEWHDSQTVYMERVYLDGMASDDHDIADIKINGQSIDSIQGQMVFFNQELPLEEGENTVDIVALDTAGNQTKQTFTIIRRIPEALQLDARLKVSVFPFNRYETAWNEANIFQDYLIDELIGQHRFRVVERSLLDLILQEQRLSATGIMERDTALKIGRLAAAQSLIAGSIVETRHGIEIVSRMIDTETSDILAAVDVFGAADTSEVLSLLARGLAMKYHHEFPLTGGRIIERNGDTILTDMGQEKIKLQRRLIIYRERPVHHPADQRILGMDKEILGRARVIQVQEKISKARLMDDAKASVDELYKVISE